MTLEEHDETAGTRERILDAAARLFDEQGYHATTIRQVASAVGIQGGSLYNHFSGKQDLLFRIAYDTMRDMLDAALRGVDPGRSPEGNLRAFVRSHVLYSIRERHRARVADEELRGLEAGNRTQVVAMRDEYEQLLKDILRDGRDRAGWDVPDVSVTAFAIATMCSAVYTWFDEGGRLGDEAVADVYAGLAVNAVARRGAL